MFIAFEYLFNIRFSIENVTLHSNIGQNSLISIVTQCAGTQINLVFCSLIRNFAPDDEQ